MFWFFSDERKETLKKRKKKLDCNVFKRKGKKRKWRQLVLITLLRSSAYGSKGEQRNGLIDQGTYTFKTDLILDGTTSHIYMLIGKSRGGRDAREQKQSWSDALDG